VTVGDPLRYIGCTIRDPSDHHPGGCGEGARKAAINQMQRGLAGPAPRRPTPNSGSTGPAATRIVGAPQRMTHGDDPGTPRDSVPFVRYSGCWLDLQPPPLFVGACAASLSTSRWVIDRSNAPRPDFASRTSSAGGGLSRAGRPGTFMRIERNLRKETTITPSLRVHTTLLTARRAWTEILLGRLCCAWHLHPRPGIQAFR
jgi:hypothetical protein